MKYLSFYSASMECYSNAEGGCYYVHTSPVACYPRRLFAADAYDDTSPLDLEKVHAEADRLNLTLEGTEIYHYRDELNVVHYRKVRPISSCAPEANARFYDGETEPFENRTTSRPVYE